MRPLNFHPFRIEVNADRELVTSLFPVDGTVDMHKRGVFVPYAGTVVALPVPAIGTVLFRASELASRFLPRVLGAGVFRLVITGNGSAKRHAPGA